MVTRENTHARISDAIDDITMALADLSIAGRRALRDGEEEMARVVARIEEIMPTDARLAELKKELERIDV